MVAVMSMKVMSSVVLLMSLNLIFTLLDVQAIDSIRFMNHIDRHLKRPKGKTKKGKSSAGSTKGPKKGKKTKGKSMNKGTTLSAPTITPSVVVKSNPVTTVPSGSPSTSPTKVPSDRPSTSPTESTQRIALTNFYNGISVGTRSALTNWLVGDECNTDNPWNGITCVDGQVTRLDLWQQGLSGTISPYLGNITSLVYVYLRWNSFTGTVPDTIGSLTALTYFDVSKNLLTGSIPTTFGFLTSLASLHFYDTQMTGTMPAEVCNLRSGELTTLKVDCSASGGTAEIECDYPSCCTVCTLI